MRRKSDVIKRTENRRIINENIIPTGIIDTSFSRANMIMYNESTEQPVTKMMMAREITSTIDAATR